jgi:hypothetical protein
LIDIELNFLKQWSLIGDGKWQNQNGYLDSD